MPRTKAIEIQDREWRRANFLWEDFIRSSRSLGILWNPRNIQIREVQSDLSWQILIWNNTKDNLKEFSHQYLQPIK